MTSRLGVGAFTTAVAFVLSACGGGTQTAGNEPSPPASVDIEGSVVIDFEDTKDAVVCGGHAGFEEPRSVSFRSNGEIVATVTTDARSKVLESGVSLGDSVPCAVRVGFFTASLPEAEFYEIEIEGTTSDPLILSLEDIEDAEYDVTLEATADGSRIR